MQEFGLMPDACAFCDRISRGQFDEKWDHPLGRVVRFEPLNPVTPGHMLIVPEAHVRNAGWDSQVYAETSRCAAEYAGRSEEAFNIITSAGSDASQTVWHLHVHVVPRRRGDGLWLPWTKIDVVVDERGYVPVAIG